MRTRSTTYNYVPVAPAVHQNNSRPKRPATHPPKVRQTGVVKNQKRKHKWSGKFRHRSAAGLDNPHNYCYRRSLLQCLLHIPAFYNQLGVMHTDCDCLERECTVCALQALMQKYWNEPNRSSFPVTAVTQLDRAIRHDGVGSTFRDARTKRQGDPHELLTFLVDQMANKEDRRATARLNKLLYMKLRESWPCEDCGHERIGFNGAGDLGYQLNVADKEDLTLEQRLQAYHHDQLDWTCNLGCAGLGPVQKPRQPTKTITQAPLVLCIQFKRLHIKIREGRAPQYRKSTEDVDYPEELSLAEFSNLKSGLKYKLQGVVAHRGNLEGHYIAAVRDIVGNRFTTISDSGPIVTSNDWQSLRWPQLGSNYYDPTLLFYVRM